jgi:hypothetical protein
LAEELHNGGESLFCVVTQIAGRRIGKLVEEIDARDHGKPITFKQLAGNLRQCLKYVEKNHRYIPLIADKVGVGATPDQRDAVQAELGRITNAARYIAGKSKETGLARSA